MNLLPNPYQQNPVYAAGNNPYLSNQAQAITRNVTDNFQQNVVPGINSGAMMAGGFGGSRQGVAQGLAASRLNQDLAGALSNLYGNAYESDANRNLQAQMANMQDSTNRFNAVNSYNLGLGNLGLGYQNANQNFYTAQRGQDLQQQQLAANNLATAYGLGASQGTGLYNAGNLQQQAPGNILSQYASMISPFSGLGGSASQSQTSGGGLGGVLGGALTGAQLWKLLFPTG